MKVAHALMVSGVAADLANPHNFGARDAHRILETIEVPALEKGHIHAYVRGIKPVVSCYPVEESAKMFDVVHGLQVFLFGIKNSFYVIVRVVKGTAYPGKLKGAFDPEGLEGTGGDV